MFKAKYSYDLSKVGGYWDRGHFESMLAWCVDNHVSFSVTKKGNLRIVEVQY